MAPQVKSGSLSRKVGAAMKAMSDYSVLKDWIAEQVENEVKGSEAKRQAEMERLVLAKPARKCFLLTQKNIMIFKITSICLLIINLLY